jgi:mannitol/fructose-specific phosphotransferase system IIA component (Ntr-type)
VYAAQMNLQLEEKHLDLLKELAKRQKWYTKELDGTVSLLSSSDDHEELASVKWVRDRGYNVLWSASIDDFDSVDAVIAAVYGNEPSTPPAAGAAGAGVGADKDAKASVVTSKAQGKTSEISTTEPKITDPEYAKALQIAICVLSKPPTDSNMPHVEKEARNTIVEIMNRNTDFKGAFQDLANLFERRIMQSAMQSAIDAEMFDQVCEREAASVRRYEELRKQLNDGKVVDLVALQKRVKELELRELAYRHAAAAPAIRGRRGRRGGGIGGSFE